MGLEEKSESKRQKTLERELEWIRMSPKARQAKGQARVTAYEKLLSQEVEKYRGEQEIYIPPGPRLGDAVIDFENVTKGYGERLLLEDFSARIPPGFRRGIPSSTSSGSLSVARETIQS